MKKVMRAAIKLYREFRGKEPRRVMTMQFDLPESAVVIGHVEEIYYRTTQGGKAQLYRHPFQEGSRPLLCVSPDGKQLLLFGGRYKFTDRGIVDRNADGTLNFDPDHGADEGYGPLGPAFMRRRQAE